MQYRRPGGIGFIGQRAAIAGARQEQRHGVAAAPSRSIHQRLEYPADIGAALRRGPSGLPSQKYCPPKTNGEHNNVSAPREQCKADPDLKK